MRAGLRPTGTRIACAVAACLRALPFCMAIPCMQSAAAQGQPAPAMVLTSDIPAQPLARALSALAAQTGVQLVYVSEIAEGRHSHAVRAGMSLDRALQRMLLGSGLRFEFLTPRSVRVLAVTPAPRAASPDDPDTNDALTEVIVTASRRAERAQDLPMSISVLTEQTLREINATEFEDYVGYLPNVTAHGVGPNQNSLYIRGLDSVETGVQGAGFNSSFPTVAVYLDEQPVALPGRNLDVYTADLSRVEVLEGPQGTLFGAGAEAGVVRYITNRPELNVTSGSVDAGFAMTRHGAPSASVTAVLNVPLVADRLAIRGVFYNERRGGYIDNPLATFARSNQDISAPLYAAGAIPAHSVVINNAAIAGTAINPATTSGLRVEMLYQINDAWRALIAQSYQSLDTDGLFTETGATALGEPSPDLTTQMFNPSHLKDRFENTALTVEGRVGDLKLLYSGAYLVRNIDQVQDYTSYAHGGLYIDYYQCINPGTPAARCFSPSSTWRNQERNTHQSQELRLTTPDERRMRAVGGLYFENYLIQNQADWFYLTALPYFDPIAPPTGYWTVNGSPFLPSGELVCPCDKGAVVTPGKPTVNNPDVRPPGDAFFNDITRGYRQKAAYASVDFDVLPQRLILTLGTRFSDINISEEGVTVSSFGCQTQNNPPLDPCINRDFSNLNALGLDRSESGFSSRASLSWRIGADDLIYYTWSQGLRYGYFNRGFEPSYNSPLAFPASNVPPFQQQASAHGGWQAPIVVQPDTLINNEIGWKTRWLDQRLQWNGVLYQENWNHAQTDSLAAEVFGNVSGSLNGGDYRVRGIETSGIARLLDGLTLELAAVWNHSELTRQAVFYWLDGTPIDFSTLTTARGQKLGPPTGPLGSPLAGCPAFRGNARARYEFPLHRLRAFAQLGIVHQASSLSSTDLYTFDQQGVSTAYRLPPFTTLDAALGARAGAWTVQLYAENLSDQRAQLYANDRQYFEAITVNRPRTIGLRFSFAVRQNQD